ncbi:GNAT family N-acetyltransferase [Zongyangia hominis]|uniref:GNAT family N-acetyltransferase n=1 Tax=Zongyangia hominis TaxID=2763677 RepID=A0A926EEP0_9FIRM|nr:GNAT family protein [Zongyangia hominis]MBC8570342.1 GNAT family N-acetyltransferase [Zongyangia hominis]
MEFSLRPWLLTDVPSVLKYADNEKIAANLRDVFPHPYTEADAVGYVSSCIGAGEERQLTRAIVVGGEAVGSIGIFLQEDVYRKSGELGYWLAEPFWGKGVMTRAIRRLCGEAFARYDIVRIYAEPYASNMGSRRALEKAGFTLEGVLRQSVYKRGRLLDSCIYSLLKEESPVD